MKTVIFDLGNVIIKWDPFRALNGIFATPAEMEHSLNQIGFFAWNAEQDRGRGWQDGIAVAKRDMPEHAHIFQAYVDGLEPAHDQLVPGTSELITRLQIGNVPMIGLTNASLKTVEIAHGTAPVLKLMKDIVISAEIGLIKPGAAIFHYCLETNNLSATDCLFVDDNLDNCEAAEKTGMTAHHFTDATRLEQVLQNANLL